MQRAHLPEERQQLEANVLRDGCSDALVAWNGVLLDGHNRFEICGRHGLDFGVTQIDLADRDAAANWIDTNQLDRRNLSPLAASEIRGRLYNRLKKSPAQAGAMKGSVRQNDGSSETAERLATQHGVSPRTIERDGQFAEAVEELKPYVPDIQARVMRGEVATRADGYLVCDSDKVPAGEQPCGDLAISESRPRARHRAPRVCPGLTRFAPTLRPWAQPDARPGVRTAARWRAEEGRINCPKIGRFQ